jgi:hypothetical protein
MKLTEKFDNLPAGLVSGLILPFVTGLIIYFFTSGPQSIHQYIMRIAESNIITHAITLCVFPNLVIFLVFNRYDMLRANRGVLAITIVWAVIVFSIKLF